MLQPAILLDVLRIAAAFSVCDDKVVFAQVKVGMVEHFAVERFVPAQNWLWIRDAVEHLFVANEGDEESVFVDDDGAAAAKAFDEGDAVLAGAITVDEFFFFAGDAHDDGARGSFADDAPVARIGTQECFFQQQLVVDGIVGQM